MNINEFEKKINRHFKKGLYKTTFYNPLHKPELLKFRFKRDPFTRIISVQIKFCLPRTKKIYYIVLTESDVIEFLENYTYDTDFYKIANDFINLFTLVPTINKSDLNHLDREYRSKTGFKHKRTGEQIKQDFEKEIHKLEECFETLFNIEIKQGVYIEFDYKHFDFELVFNL